VRAERIRLTADYGVWQLVIRQELNPLRGILLGRIVVHGHLPDLLRYREAVLTMCELAGRLDTTFVRA
jgi:putative sterol carrier protein